LEAIEKAVCCMELKDVIKIVIIQACQGKTRGKKTKLNEIVIKKKNYI